MTDHDGDVRASLHHPALDAGISANSLLAGVRRRKHRLQRRQRTVRAATAALATVVVIWGTALLVPDRTPTVQPAQQPSVEATTTPVRSSVSVPTPPILPTPQPLPTPPILPTRPLPATSPAVDPTTVNPSGPPTSAGPVTPPTSPDPTG